MKPVKFYGSRKFHKIPTRAYIQHDVELAVQNILGLDKSKNPIYITNTPEMKGMYGTRKKA